MKDLLTSLRASNETYNSMKHSARAIIRRAEIPLLAVIVLYKAATNLLFVPLMHRMIAGEEKISEALLLLR